MSEPAAVLQRLADHGDGELLDLCATSTLAVDLPSLLRLCQACTTLRNRLAGVRATAEARRMRWTEELSDTPFNLNINNERRTLTKVGQDRFVWGVGPLLPTEGRFSFSIRIEDYEDDEDTESGMMLIGVCNEAVNCTWGLWVDQGTLGRISRDEEEGEHDDAVPPPEGWPDGQDTQIMINEAGENDNLRGRAVGAVIEVLVDHSDGSLAFGINGELPRRVPDVWPPHYDPENPHNEDELPARVPFRFPQGAQLRPMVRLYYEDHEVCFAPGYLCV